MGDDEKQRKIKTSDVKEFVHTSVESTDFHYNDLGNASSVDKLHERIRELEALVGGKEEALKVALQGLDSAMGVEVEYRAQLEGCRARVGEFQQAVQHRDQLIEQLSASLEHTLRARDELAQDRERLVQDGERLAQEVSLLRSQLQATSELVAQGSSKSQHDFMLLQHKNLALEDAVKKKDAQIEEMQRQLTEQEGLKKELEVKKGELSRYKTEAASHVQQLMKEVECLHRESANSKSLEWQRTQQIAGLQQEHERELAALRAELEEHFGQQLMQIQEKHRSQYLEQNLQKHSTSFEQSGASSSDSISAQQQLQELSERAQQVAADREDLLSQLSLYKDQVQSLSEKLMKSSPDDSLPNSHENIAKENQTLKEKVESLNEQLRAIEEQRIPELEMFRQSQAAEISSWKKRVNSLTLELQKVSEVAESYLLRLEECTKVHEAELSSLHEAHTQELKFLGSQVEGMQQLQAQANLFHANLQEKTSMEKRLQTELQASIRSEEDLKGRLMEVQEELQVLRGAFSQQKDVLQRQSNDLEKLSAELLDKERSELVLKEELALLKDRISSAKATDDKKYKEQIDKLNELLQQKRKMEEELKEKLLEKEKIEVMLKKKIEEQSEKYKVQLDSLNVQLQEKTKIEEQLRNELCTKEKAGEALRNELKSVKAALKQLEEATGEAELYKKQVDSLNRQLQERSQNENQIISDYETRVKSLTFDLSTIESRLSTEIQDIQSRAREELLSKQETEKRLEKELETVCSELLILKSSSDVQEYKEQINKLNLLVQEKQKTETSLKAELEAVSAEVATLKDNQQHLENLNSDLEERLQTEQRLQEELIAAAKMHKEQVDVLSAKISELTSQQNSLDNEAHSMRQEINAQKTYIRDLELIREQVSESAKTKEVLINDLSVCVKSLTEDNASYQEKLENLNKRLDDECHRADENMMLREVYEKEISEHKLHIEELERKLQDALQAKNVHLNEISVHQQELKSYKEQLETLNCTFTKEITLLQQKYANSVDESVRGTEVLKKELEATKIELSSYKEQTDKLNQQIAEEKKRREEEFKREVEIMLNDVENFKNQLSLMTETKNKLEEEKNLYSEQLKTMHVELSDLKENISKETEAFSKAIKSLEADIAVKDERILKLNMELEDAASKFDDVNKLLLEAHQKFPQDREAITKLWKTEENDAKLREKVSEFHSLEVEEPIASASAPIGVQESAVVQERLSKDRDSLNLSSISETELLQLESKLQHALNEKNEIEKSFKDHVNKLAESHQKEVAVYEEQLQMVRSNLEQLMKNHSSCALEKNALRDEMNKLTLEYKAKTTAYEEKLSIAAKKVKELSEVCEKQHSEKEALEKQINELNKMLKEKGSSNDHVNKLSSQFEKDISRYAEQLKVANETLDDLSKKYSNCLAENDTLKANMVKLCGFQEEISLYKEQLKKACEKFEDLSAIHMKCDFEKDLFVKKISEKELAFQEKDSVLQKKSEALSVCQRDLVQMREYMELLKVNLQDEISKVHVELRNLVNICAPVTNETMNEMEVLKDVSSEDLSFTNGKDNWSPSWSQGEDNGNLEQSFVCAATIHHDVSSLRCHVERLVSDLISARQKSSVTEGLLAAKEESETIFKKHIDQLQQELHKNDEEKLLIKEQLEELTVKFLTAQSLLAGKVEAENSLQREVDETPANTCNKCKHLEEEISSLNLTLLETRDKLKDAEREKEKSEKRYVQFEEEKEKYFLEKANLEKSIEDLRQKTADSQLIDDKICKLEELLKESENTRDSVVLENNSLKEDHRKLFAEKQRLEEILEGMKAEVVRYKDEKEKVFLEKVKLETLIEDLRQKTEDPQLIDSKVCRLEEMLKESEKTCNSVVLENSSLKEDHEKLLAEKKRLEEILEEVKTEVVRYQEEKQKKLVEKANLEKLIEDLRQKTEDPQLIDSKICRLEELLKESENARDSIVLENNSLKEEHGKLLAEKKRLEEVLEEMKAEVVRYKDEKEKVFLEKVKLEKLIEDLRQKTEDPQLTDSKVCRLEEMLKESEKARNSMVLENSSLKEQHGKLLAENKRLEEVLEEMKAEVVRYQELQNDNLGNAEEIPNDSAVVEKGTQEQLSSVKEEVGCIQIRESNSSHNVEGPSDLDYFAALPVEEVDTLESSSLSVLGDAVNLSKPKRSLHTVALKLMEQCGLLDSAKRTLTAECETLRLRLEEREAQELLFNEELAAANSRCAALEQRLQESCSKAASLETMHGAKVALECELQALAGENSALKAEKVSLMQEQLSLQEELQNLRTRVERGFGDASFDKSFVQEFASQYASFVAVKEKLSATEREKITLEIQVEALTKAKQDVLKQFELVLEEARELRQQLEAAWQERAEVEEQLGRARCELAVAGLRRESRANSGNPAGALSPSTPDGPVFHLHQEVHSLVEEMAQELVSLRQALQSERCRQEQLEAALKSNEVLVQEKQALLEQLRSQQVVSSGEGASTEGDLLTQLSVYREQHEGLAEVIGPAGALQESLRQQKEELLAVLQEKSAVEEQLASEKAEGKSWRVKMQLMEQQLHEKDLLYQEVLQQKSALQLDLQQLEEKLREREQLLQMQRAQLQGELRTQELRLRRWQLQQRASEVERKLDESLRSSPGAGSRLPEAETELEASNAEVESHLRSLREEMQRAHTEAIARLKQHLEAEFAVRERALKAGFTVEMAGARAAHEGELARLQHALLSAEQEINKLRNAELVRCLGNGGYTTEELTATKERYEQELGSICSGLDEGQAHLFAVLKHLFEEFARQLVAGTTSLIQSQNEKVVEREVAKLNALHQQQVEQLQAKLEGDHLQALQTLQEMQKAPADAESDPLHSISSAAVVMTYLHSADSSQVAIVQLKHLLYSEYTFALKEATKGWAAAWSEEVGSQLQALEKALDEEAAALQRLRDSPEAPAAAGAAEASPRRPVEDLFKETEALTARAEEMLERKLKVAEEALRVVGERLDAAFSPVAERAKLMAAAQRAAKETPATDGEVAGSQYRQLAQQLSAEHAAEAGRLRELLAQLEARRTREMEELRLYFEQKVQELEKHYSEEITSQHSRRHSSSSCESDSEFATDALLGSGDHAMSRIPPLTHICDTCAADPGYKELEERWRGELAKRVEEGRSQLSAAKKELEARYEGELARLRSYYEEKLGCLAGELGSAQQVAVQAAKRSACKSLQAVWRREIRTARSRLLKVVSQLSSTASEGDDVEAKLNGRTEPLESSVPEGDSGGENLEDLCVELSSQLRQLEAVCRQCLQMQKEQLLKEREGVLAERAVEEASVQSVQHVLSKVQLEEKVRAEVRAELEQELEQQVEKVAALMKANAEQEQMMFIENQKQMMKDFLEQHRRDLEVLKKQHQVELNNAKTAPKSNDVISTSEATQVDLQSVLRRHEMSQTDQQLAPKRLDAAVSPTHCSRMHKEVQTEEPDAPDVSMTSQEVQTSPWRGSPMLADASPERLRAQPFEANSLSLLSELSTAEETRRFGGEQEDIRGMLTNVQTECARFLEAMFQEWVDLQHRLDTGLVKGKCEIKFLTKEYIVECCLRLKVILSTLETKIMKLQEDKMKHQSSSKLSCGIQASSNDCLPSAQLTEIIQERNRWRHVGMVLKKLVEELLTYLSECEDEVNHTLLSEQVDEKEVEEESCVTEASVETVDASKEADPSRLTPKPRRGKRVHFAPTTFDLKNLNEQMLLEFIQEDEDLSAKLRAELDVCLEQLRMEAATLMESPFVGSPCTPCRGASVEDKRVEALTRALGAAKQRIADLEAERRIGVRSEEVAEGFGEHMSSTHQGAAFGLRLQSLSQLQDKARSILANGRPSSPQEAQQLRLLDEICREGDRLAEEARREREDLRQQVPPHPCSPDLPLPREHPECCGCCRKVESADKRLRDTRRFLEEQAAEREQERDEFQQELVRLQEQLRTREKDLADQQRLSREVEALEQQAKEALARHQQLEAHREALQAELKAAVDKVWLLRDVVAELELQAEAKDARALHLESRLQELQQALQEQETSRQQLTEELEALRAEGGSELSRQVAALQEQLHAHRLQAEQCRPAAIKQMRAQIRELEANVERRTKQLEDLHTLSSNQSSPSEDVSVREMFQCDSPDDLRAAVASPSLAGSLGSSPRSPPPTPLPLRELARLQERLLRHARAEEAALKKTRDLEMQLKAARRAEEEASSERDVLQERVSEQLLRIASLEALVDAGRWKGSCAGAGVQEEEDEEERQAEQELLQEQQLLLRRVQDAEEEAARCAQHLETARREMQQLKEAATQAETSATACARRESALMAQLQTAQRAESAARERCEVVENKARELAASYQPLPSGSLTPIEVLIDNLLLSNKNAENDDLRKRLEAHVEQLEAQLQVTQEQLRTAQAEAEQVQHLHAQLHDVQKQLAEAEAQRERDAAQGLEELAGQVEKELEASAQLDSSLLQGLSLCTPHHEPSNDTGKISPRPDVRSPVARISEELVQCAPGPSSADEENQHLQWQLQDLQQQLHQQLQQMQEATHAHVQKENQLQSSLLAEKERVSELQRTLRREQRRALDLQSQLASQAVRAGLAVDETRLQQTSQETEQERSKVRALEQQLQQERTIVRQLKSALLTERQRFQEAQKKDAQLLQAMRLRLGEVAASAGDRQRQQVLPAKAEEPPQTELPPRVPSPAPADTPPAPEGSQTQPEVLNELQHRLLRTQSEIRALRRRLNREQETAQQLTAEINLLRGHNDSLDAQLSEVRTALATQQAEKDQLARQLRALEEAELRQKSRASSERSIAQERARQLELNVAQLEAEVAAERVVREEAVAEAARLREAVEALRKGADAAATTTQARSEAAPPTPRLVEAAPPTPRPVEAAPPTPRPVEPLPLKDVSAILDQQVKEHSKVALTLARLVEERRELLQRTSTLSEQLAELQRSEAKALASVTRLTAEKASVTEECIALRLELARVKEQLYQKRSETADTQELENRVNHLFGRYLRAESYRKALAWQKKYLLVALGGYQQTEAYTLSQLAQLTSAPNGAPGHKNSRVRAQTRFRRAALVIVAIQRMKFMVRRWYYGRQIGGSTVLNQSYTESLFSGLSAQGMRRSRGNSAFSVSSWSIPASASASASVSLGAMPHSPPRQDHSSRSTRAEARCFSSWRSTEGLASGLASTLAPSRLTQFVERYDSLQHRLGLATTPTVALASSASSQRGED